MADGLVLAEVGEGDCSSKVGCACSSNGSGSDTGESGGLDGGEDGAGEDGGRKPAFVLDRGSLVAVEPAASLDPTPEDRPRRVFAPPRSLVLLRHDWSMLARRILDEDVAGLGSEVVGVEPGNEGVSLAGSEELFVAEEGGEGEGTSCRGCCFRGGVGIHAGDNEFGLCALKRISR